MLPVALPSFLACFFAAALICLVACRGGAAWAGVAAITGVKSANSAHRATASETERWGSVFIRRVYRPFVAAEVRSGAGVWGFKMFTRRWAQGRPS